MTSTKRSLVDDLASRSEKRRRTDIINDGRASDARSEIKVNDHIRISFPTTPAAHAPPFSYPLQLISFSYLPSRELVFDDSALKYFVQPPRGADLNYAYDRWIKKPEERGRLDNLLTACLGEQAKHELKRANVVSWRGVLTKILTAPYEKRDGWDLNIMLVNGTLFFEEHLNDARLQQKESVNPRNRIQMYYGYAFESYCTSSTPFPGADKFREMNGWGGDVDNNVQWCSVVKTKLGDSRIIIGGEVDCVNGKYTGQPNTFVELKTSLAIRGPQDESRFEQKLLKFYFQSFLLGVPEIRVGFRTPSGRLTEVQNFRTVEIPRLIRGKANAWDPNLCLEWGNQFLSIVKSTIDGFVSSATDSDATESRTLAENVWRATFFPDRGVELALLDDDAQEEVRNGEDRIGFLPRSFWDVIVNPLEIPESQSTERN